MWIYIKFRTCFGDWSILEPLYPNCASMCLRLLLLNEPAITNRFWPFFAHIIHLQCVLPKLISSTRERTYVLFSPSFNSWPTKLLWYSPRKYLQYHNVWCSGFSKTGVEGISIDSWRSTELHKNKIRHVVYQTFNYLNLIQYITPYEVKILLIKLIM